MMMSSESNVVLIDDEIAMRESVSQFLSLSDCHVQSFANPADAINVLDADFSGVVVTDLRMPTLDGMAVLDAVKFIDPQIPVVMITGHGDIDSAVQAMRDGAYDFIEKPFQPQRLLATVIRAQDKRRLVLSNRQLRSSLGISKDVNDRLLGDCEAIISIREEIKQFANVDVNVLITGEIGTGKSVVAQCLHSHSEKDPSTLVRVDCSGVKEFQFIQNMMSDCANGTLVLENIDQLPQPSLGLLPAALQEHNARLVSTTTQQNLASLEHAEHRLSTITLHLPKLTLRSDDVILLFNHFSSLASLRFDMELPELSTSDIATLQTHSWPGNVHELEKIGERFVLYQTQSIDQLIDESRDIDVMPSLHQQVQAFERSVIEHALANHQGILADAANELGIPRRTLNDKLQRHGIDRERFQN